MRQIIFFMIAILSDLPFILLCTFNYDLLSDLFSSVLNWLGFSVNRILLLIWLAVVVLGFFLVILEWRSWKLLLNCSFVLLFLHTALFSQLRYCLYLIVRLSVISAGDFDLIVIMFVYVELKILNSLVSTEIPTVLFGVLSTTWLMEMMWV